MRATATKVCTLGELDEGIARRFVIGDRAVAVVRLGNDVYAIGDTCSHAEVSLSEGDVDADETTIECPKHGSTFDLRTGEPGCLPAVRPVPVYDVVVDGVEVSVTPTNPDETHEDRS